MASWPPSKPSRAVSNSSTASVQRWPAAPGSSGGAAARRPGSARSPVPYGGLRLEQGDLPGADTLARRALDIQRRTLFPGHGRRVPVLTLLGQILTDSNCAAEAEPLLREAVAIDERRLRAAHYEIARARSELGTCLAALGPAGGIHPAAGG